MFDEVTGFPLPGRRQIDYLAARTLLVEEFPQSTTRAGLWQGLDRYLARFFWLESHYQELLGGEKLVPALWLGGSFASSKLDPNNIDLTVLLNDRQATLLRGQPGVRWLADAFSRARVVREYGLSPLEIRYRPLPSVFMSERLPPPDQKYLRERGAWDDWWQRCRTFGVEEGAPTVESAAPRRGYLEVIV